MLQQQITVSLFITPITPVPTCGPPNIVGGGGRKCWKMVKSGCKGFPQYYTK